MKKPTESSSNNPNWPFLAKLQRKMKRKHLEEKDLENVHFISKIGISKIDISVENAEKL